MRYYIIAGEASGDLHGSNLIKGLIAEDPEAEFRYWGGDFMTEATKGGKYASHLVKHYKEGAVMGLIEVLGKATKLLDNLKFCKNDILNWKPDVVILIDYPGFNMKIAKFCHDNGIKVFYYIAPKTWASREGRNRKLKAWVDQLFIVLPFEIPYFTKAEIPFIYEGNPLLDAVDSHHYSKPAEGKYIALLVGSRKAEISRSLPICMEMVDKLSKMSQYADYQFIVAGAPARSKEDYEQHIAGRSNVKLVFGRTYDIISGAEAAVVNSGTASLETALIGTPQVVVWNTSALTYFAATKILNVLKNIKYISLGNLCIDKLAFKELIQDKFTAEAITEEVRSLIEDGTYRQQMLDDYKAIRDSLGGSGASRKVARAMINLIK